MKNLSNQKSLFSFFTFGQWFYLQNNSLMFLVCGSWLHCSFDHLNRREWNELKLSRCKHHRLP